MNCDINIYDIIQRARRRSESVWRPLDVRLEGLHLEGERNRAGVLSVLQRLVPILESSYFELMLQNRQHDFDITALLLENDIITRKIQAEREALAMRVAGQLAQLRAKEYEALVQKQIMDARLYALEVDREGVELQRLQYVLTAKREEAQEKVLRANILMQMFERRNLTIEIARTELEVARANLRAILSGIGAEEAEIRVIKAILSIYEAEAEKAGLLADVAQILADIVVRGLAAVRLAVERAEIENAFIFVEQRIADLMAIMEVKLDIEQFRADMETLFKDEISRLSAAQEDAALLERLRQDMLERVQEYAQLKQKVADECAALRRGIEHARRLNLADIKTQSEIALFMANSYSELLLADANAAASKFQRVYDYSSRVINQIIRKGQAGILSPGSATFGGGGLSNLANEFLPPPVHDIASSDDKCQEVDKYI